MASSTNTRFLGCGIGELRVRGGERGSLIAFERLDLPFAIERVYYIFGTLPGVERGLHSQRALHQWPVCVSGSCAIVLDDGSPVRVSPRTS